jgi:hypothetical protein
MSRAMAQTINSFGRRGGPVVRATAVRSPVVQPRSGPVAPEAQDVPGETIDIFYTRRVSWMAIVILVLATMEAKDFFPSGQGDAFAGTGIAPWQLWSAYGIAIAVALTFLFKGLTGARALRLNPHGISGFTLMGTKNIAWSDIDQLEIVRHELHGDFLLIHGKTATWIGRRLWLNSISLGLKHIDRSLDDLVRELQSYRPDVPVPRGT